MITRELVVSINRDLVFHQIDCNKDSDLYEEFLEEYQEMEPDMYALCEPVFIMEYDTIGPELAREGIPEGTPVLMVIYSIGAGISKYSTQSFVQGDYVKGMLADAMADSALISLEKEIMPYVKEECAKRKLGISRRLKAPKDISMKAQKVIFDKIGAHEKCGMNISSGYMLDPVKSNALLYLLTEDDDVLKLQNDCGNCSKDRNSEAIPVQLIDGENHYSLMVKEGESILDALILYDSSFTAICGGTGRCGKCKIKVTEGNIKATDADRKHFSEEELDAGMRLSCMAYPSEPIRAELYFKGESRFQVLTDYSESQTGQQNIVSDTDTFAIAIDIGTTTIAVQLMNLHTRVKMATYTGINHQRSQGADVVSRIKASVEGKKTELKRMIQQDLQNGIRQVISQAGILPQRIADVMIAGNTTMIHLLMGYDCKGLGEFPFTPVSIEPITESYETILEDDLLSATVKILPGISTFVGGDIVAGIYTCDMDTKEEYSLLIDLGTNGEIALGNKDKMIVTSTAAGPAFEGGNIEYGVGSMEGAIAGVKIEEHKAVITTIANKPPIGICGTGVIEAVSELVKSELVDETGCLDDEYFDDGFPLAVTKEGTQIVLTQQDIREIQLAKSAVRAGIETLFLRFGIEKEEVAHVYVAGGFGYKLDCKKAIEIGMFPEVFADKIEAVGNSSLGGVAKCLFTEDGWQRICRINKYADEINLSADKEFNQFYMDHMYLSREDI